MKRIESADERFHDGNPATGELGTILPAGWLNDIQEEIATVVEGQGIALDGAKRNQLAAAIAKVVATHAEGRGHPAATEALQGMTRHATLPEHKAGARTDRSAHPAGVAAFVRQYGLGTDLPNMAEASLDDLSITGFYQGTSSTNDDPFAGSRIIHLERTEAVGQATQILAQNNPGNRMGFRTKFDGVWTAFFELFHSGNLAQATANVLGLVRWATTSEHTAGSSSERAVHPAGMKATIDDRVADQPTVDAGTNDAKFVTPKKLRWGFDVSFGQKSYIVLPSWLGGVIIQFGHVAGLGSSNSYVTPLPIALPNAIDIALAVDNSSHGDSNGIENVSVSTDIYSQTTEVRLTKQGVVGALSWLVIGH